MCTLFSDDIMMIDETRDKFHVRLEVRIQTTKSKGFRLSKTKTDI